MSKSVDEILRELGMATPDIPPINKHEAIEMGLVEKNFAPQKGPCGKSVYTSESRCDQAIKHRLRSGFGGTGFLRGYFCEICCGWHMSSSNNKKNK